MSICILTPRILYAVSVRNEIEKETNIKFELYNEHKGSLSHKYIII